jgi:uncharacterized membrane protein YfcA
MSSDLPILLAGTFAAAFASGMAGFAFGLVAAGILFHWLPPAELAPLVVIGSLLMQISTVGTVRHVIRWATLKPYMIGGVLGTPFGVLILRVADARLIVVGIGTLLVAYAGYMLARIALRLSQPRLRAGPAADAGIGFAGGVLGGIGGFSGALPAMWVDLKGMRKDEARAILQPFILAMQAAAAVGLAAGGFIGRDNALTLLTVLPALMLGGWLGVRAYKVIPAEGFRVVLLGLLLLSGLSLVI